MEGSTNPGRRKAYVAPEIRESTVTGLVSLRQRGLLSAVHVDAVASGLGVTGRSVWRWLASARQEGRAIRKPRAHFELSDEDVSDLAYHFGNVSALHRDRLTGVGLWATPAKDVRGGRRRRGWPLTEVRVYVGVPIAAETRMFWARH
jgi:hypothetical protein